MPLFSNMDVGEVGTQHLVGDAGIRGGEGRGHPRTLDGIDLGPAATSNGCYSTWQNNKTSPGTNLSMALGPSSAGGKAVPFESKPRRGQ